MSWLDAEDVASWLQQPESEEDPSLIAAADAAGVYVLRVRPEFLLPVDPEADPVVYVYTPDEDVKLGAIMLAARWFTRRGTPLGVAGFAEFAGNMVRNDPDISRLLRIGSHAPFVFGAPALPVEEESA